MRTSPGCDPHATLAELERLALEAGCPEIAAEARALDERLAEGRFFVVCVGQFKRGKSTLLNTTNIARAQNDLIERARQSRQRLETEIRGRISEAHEVAARALARAREAHAAGGDAVRAELDRLDHLRRVVAALTDGERAEAGRAG